jgi:hypothetical protein
MCWKQQLEPLGLSGISVWLKGIEIEDQRIPYRKGIKID